LLRLAIVQRGGPLWSRCVEQLAILRCTMPDDDADQRRLRETLDRFIERLRVEFQKLPESKDQARQIVSEILDFVDRDAVKQCFPAYRQGDWFEKVVDAIIEHLSHCCTAESSWAEALALFEGENSVPLMTIHKSKGLEYHTVIFVGLDDVAWWSFDQDPHESLSGFFVAFSRAKQRVFFTYCRNRGTRTKVAPLYQLLDEAGVPSRRS